MGDVAAWAGRRTVALLLVAAVAVAAVLVAVLRPSEQERFRIWLRTQPGVVAVQLVDQALASGTDAAKAFEPTLRAQLAGAPDVAVVQRLTGAIEGYAAEHPAVAGTTVELRHGRDVVLASTSTGPNAIALRVLRAMQALPAVTSVALQVQSGAAGFTATVRTGTDLVAAADDLAGALPEPGTSWLTGGTAVAVRDDVGHEVRVGPGAVVTPSAGRALALAVQQDPTHPVVLVSRTGEQRATSVIRLTGSPRTEATAAALHHAGFGLARLGQLVEGPGGPIPMDQRAWASAAGQALSRVAGVVAATVDPGDREHDRPVTADLRVVPGVSLGSVVRSLPPAVERVELHTAPAAPDYARDDALAPDPEVDCPASRGGGLNLAYSGSPAQLTRAASYVALLVAAAPDATCVHWAEPAEHRRPATQTLLVRVPLRTAAWRPVLDVVRTRRADLESAHPALILLLPVDGTDRTAVFNLHEGAAPYLGALGTQTRAQEQAVETALAPLVRYWASGSGQ